MEQCVPILVSSEVCEISVLMVSTVQVLFNGFRRVLLALHSLTVLTICLAVSLQENFELEITCLKSLITRRYNVSRNENEGK